eukprot:1150320-Pelagomonas_calceolata.AAC.8
MQVQQESMEVDGDPHYFCRLLKGTDSSLVKYHPCTKTAAICRRPGKYLMRAQDVDVICEGHWLVQEEYAYQPHRSKHECTQQHRGTDARARTHTHTHARSTGGHAHARARVHTHTHTHTHFAVEDMGHLTG